MGAGELERGVERGWTPFRTLNCCIKEAGRIDRCWGKRKARERRLRLERLQERLGRAQLALENSPDDDDCQMEVLAAGELLMEYSTHQARWVDFIIQSRWSTAGDRSTRLFYKFFKKLSSDKEIPELFNSNGVLNSSCRSWAEMADISTSFFQNILGEEAEGNSLPSEADFAEVLYSQQDYLTPAEKEAQNAPLTLGELEEAVAAMANNKCPGLDGTPNAFYKANWLVVGPLVLQCLTLGIAREAFPEFMTQGAIVLLQKKSDQRRLCNKRPITLLNSIYKIGAKAMQLRVTLILQRTISSQQSAFLPGRNIHHALLLMSEMLHRPRNREKITFC